jgi:hypothetical protein
MTWSVTFDDISRMYHRSSNIFLIIGHGMLIISPIGRSRAFAHDPPQDRKTARPQDHQAPQQTTACIRNRNPCLDTGTHTSNIISLPSHFYSGPQCNLCRFVLVAFRADGFTVPAHRALSPRDLGHHEIRSCCFHFCTPDFYC